MRTIRPAGVPTGIVSEGLSTVTPLATPETAASSTAFVTRSLGPVAVGPMYWTTAYAWTVTEYWPVVGAVANEMVTVFTLVLST